MCWRRLRSSIKAIRPTKPPVAVRGWQNSPRIVPPLLCADQVQFRGRVRKSTRLSLERIPSAVCTQRRTHQTQNASKTTRMSPSAPFLIHRNQVDTNPQKLLLPWILGRKCLSRPLGAVAAKFGRPRSRRDKHQNWRVLARQ